MYLQSHKLSRVGTKTDQTPGLAFNWLIGIMIITHLGEQEEKEINGSYDVQYRLELISDLELFSNSRFLMPWFFSVNLGVLTA